jgi:EAL domain-containing protein (putative c-di-GMP-specific phosphodiesterase class I)
VPLGEWVLRRACSDAASWTVPLAVAVNLSPAQFRETDMAETVADVLRETRLPPERLELEITESLLINDTDEVFGKLARLRELGARIVMNDFGTGYSSFSYLARFAFDKIKIDPPVRAQYAARPGHAGDRQDHHRARQVPRRDRDCRERRVQGAGGNAA